MGRFLVLYDVTNEFFVCILILDHYNINYGEITERKNKLKTGTKDGGRIWMPGQRKRNPPTNATTEPMALPAAEESTGRAARTAQKTDAGNNGIADGGAKRSTTAGRSCGRRQTGSRIGHTKHLRKIE